MRKVDKSKEKLKTITNQRMLERYDDEIQCRILDWILRQKKTLVKNW